ncbi:MAG: tetratricopeptide repeat protein [Acaryochloris sp. CRU_2_0]|nr:tetratricopeptide repeat protein [Acaryochloris sp. CRU_2_0]
MTSTRLDRNPDTQVDPQKEYRALIRSLSYSQGFGLLFVQCSPAAGERLIAKVQEDLPQKRIEVLSLTEPIETLYDQVDSLYRNHPINVLFVQGIEHSLYAYEKNRLWINDAQRRSYSETGIPRLLQHLNLSRERFWETFPFCFVFLIPHFALKYFIRRAPDFFDWNSGVFEFPMEREWLHQESARVTLEQWQQDDSWDLSPDQCRKNLLEIQALIEEPDQTNEPKANLYFEKGRLFGIVGEREEAIASYDQALQIKPDFHEAWYNRGSALGELGHYEEAIASYNQALEIKPDFHEVWTYRGIALGNLGHYQEAIASYDQALKIKPDDYDVWNIRGAALSQLGHYEGAIASYDQALKIKSDDHDVWDIRGYALRQLGRTDEAITSFDQALAIQPELADAFYNKACCYALQGNIHLAIENLQKAIRLKPNQFQELAKTDSAFDDMRDEPRFQELLVAKISVGNG